MFVLCFWKWWGIIKTNAIIAISNYTCIYILFSNKRQWLSWVTSTFSCTVTCSSFKHKTHNNNNHHQQTVLAKHKGLWRGRCVGQYSFWEGFFFIIRTQCLFIKASINDSGHMGWLLRVVIGTVHSTRIVLQVFVCPNSNHVKIIDMEKKHL